MCPLYHAIYYLSRKASVVWHFLVSLLKKRATFVEEGNPNSISNHSLTKLLVERALSQNYIVSYDDFLLIDEYLPRFGGPRGLGVGRRVFVEIGTIKIIEQVEPSHSYPSEKPSSSSQRRKKKVEKSPSIYTTGKGKEKVIYGETPCTPQPQSSVKTRLFAKRVEKESV